MTDSEEIVTISKTEYQNLQNDSIWLSALEAAGVDNWEGNDLALDILEEWNLGDV